MRQAIKSDGTVIDLPLPIGGLDGVRNLIGADCLDMVNLRNGHHMLVDDLGHPKGLPLNEKATQLYWSVCRPGTTHCIVGDVIVLPDTDF